MDPARLAVSVSHGSSTPIEPGETLEVIGELRSADFDTGTGDAYGAHDEPHAVLLPGEHMLDMSADFGSPGVGLSDPVGHGPPWRAPLVNMAVEHAGGEDASFLLDR